MGQAMSVMASSSTTYTSVNAWLDQAQRSSDLSRAQQDLTSLGSAFQVVNYYSWSNQAQQLLHRLIHEPVTEAARLNFAHQFFCHVQSSSGLVDTIEAIAEARSKLGVRLMVDETDAVIPAIKSFHHQSYFAAKWPHPGDKPKAYDMARCKRRLSMEARELKSEILHCALTEARRHYREGVLITLKRYADQLEVAGLDEIEHLPPTSGYQGKEPPEPYARAIDEIFNSAEWMARILDDDEAYAAITLGTPTMEELAALVAEWPGERYSDEDLNKALVRVTMELNIAPTGEEATAFGQAFERIFIRPFGSYGTDVAYFAASLIPFYYQHYFDDYQNEESRVRELFPNLQSRVKDFVSIILKIKGWDSSRNQTELTYYQKLRSLLTRKFPGTNWFSLHDAAMKALTLGEAIEGLEHYLIHHKVVPAWQSLRLHIDEYLRRKADLNGRVLSAAEQPAVNDNLVANASDVQLFTWFLFAREEVWRLLIKNASDERGHLYRKVRYALFRAAREGDEPQQRRLGKLLADASIADPSMLWRVLEILEEWEEVVRDGESYSLKELVPLTTKIEPMPLGDEEVIYVISAVREAYDKLKS